MTSEEFRLFVLSKGRCVFLLGSYQANNGLGETDWIWTHCFSNHNMFDGQVLRVQRAPVGLREARKVPKVLHLNFTNMHCSHFLPSLYIETSTGCWSVNLLGRTVKGRSKRTGLASIWVHSAHRDFLNQDHVPEPTTVTVQKPPSRPMTLVISNSCNCYLASPLSQTNRLFQAFPLFR